MNLWVLGINTVRCNKSHEISLSPHLWHRLLLLPPFHREKKIRYPEWLSSTRFNFSPSFAFFPLFWLSPSHFSEKKIKKGDRGRQRRSISLHGGWTTLSTLNHRNVPVFKTPRLPRALDFLSTFLLSFHLLGMWDSRRYDAQDGLVECWRIERGKVQRIKRKGVCYTANCGS